MARLRMHRTGFRIIVICVASVLASLVMLLYAQSAVAAAPAAPIEFTTAPFEVAPFKRAPFDAAPFKRAPFKRAPFKRAPFKRGPFADQPFKRANGTVASPWTSQVVPTSVERVGGLRNATAAIDGIDTELDVDIAILDGGVDASHPDLRVAGGVNCVNGGSALRDVDGHGTMVAGLAAARDNAFGIVGVAPGARIWSVRVARPDGTITEAAARCGLEWVRANAAMLEVANLSWAARGVASQDCGATPAPGIRTSNGKGTGNGAGLVDQSAEPGLHALACAARDAGVTLVAAAGNEGIDAAGVLPAAWPSMIAVSAFADFDGAPGGMADATCPTTERDDRFASFSNFGAPVAISAPGVCVATTSTGDGYAIVSGTSFAAPIVSGAAALALVQSPELTPDQVRDHLLTGAARSGPIAGDPDQTPEGVVDVGEG